jgi:predicted small metal-binding protein
MAYELNCADTGSDCSFSVRAETEDEVMQHVATHASIAHPDLELTPETIDTIKGLIRTT